MTIQLSSDREQYVRSLIEGGRFPSEDAVITEALRLLQEREDELKLASLRRDVAAGIEQADNGELDSFDPHATLARIRSRQADRHGTALMARIIRSSLAEADLDGILTDLQHKNPSVADRYAAKFAEKAKALSQFPEIGRPRPEIASGARSTLVKPYVIFYRYHNDVVQILRILHGKRDLQRIMDEEPGD